MAQEVLHAAAVSLFQYNTATQSYEGKGQVGAAITGDSNGVYKLVCYENQQSYMCTATIGSNNDSLKFQLKQTENYAGFKDDNGQQWSLYFTEENNALMFAMHVVLAIYGTAGMPTHGITSVDMSEITGDTVDVNDSVGVKFNAYYVGSEKGRPTLSYQFDSNIQSKHTYRFQIPSSNTNLTPDCKGFEGAVCGMCQGSRRCIVIPAACRRGTQAGGAGTVIVIVDVRKVKKDETPQPVMQAQAQPQAMHQQPMQQPATNFQDFQQQQMQTQPVAMLTMPGQQAVQLPIAQPLQTATQMAPLQAAPVATPVAAAPAPVAAAPAAPAAAPGLTIEQLKTVNDTAQNVTSLITNISEVSQKVDILSADFKMAQKQQKPTTLTAAQLQHSVTSMLDDNKQLKDEVKAKDDMIKTLEQRSLDLEKKVDKFAQSAHSLMEEKKSAATNASDARLEMDRRVLKLQEELQRANSERDDSQRHLATVKKLLEISEDEIRKLKGENEITKVQTENTRMKISHTEDTLKGEKESRRFAEEKILQLSGELSETRDSLQRKDAALTEKLRKIETDRVHFNNLIEEERNHAEKEMTSMRDEMLVDLQSREKRAAQEKERTAEDAYSRGRDQGKDEGLAEARIRYEEEMGRLRAGAMEAENELQSQISRLNVDMENREAEIDGLKKTVLEVTESLTDTTDKLTLRQAELDLEKEKGSTLTVSHDSEMTSLNERVTETTARLQKEMIQTEMLTEKFEDAQRKYSEAEVRWTSSIDSLSNEAVPVTALKSMCQDIFMGKTPDLSFEEDGVKVMHKAPVSSPREDDDDWQEVASKEKYDTKKDSESDDLVKVDHQEEEEARPVENEEPKEETETKPEPATEEEADAVSEPKEPEQESEAQAEVEAEAEPETQPEPEAEAEAEAEPEAEPRAEDEAEPEPEAEPEAQAEPEAEREAEPEVEPEAEPEAEQEAQAEPAVEEKEPEAQEPETKEDEPEKAEEPAAPAESEQKVSGTFDTDSSSDSPAPVPAVPANEEEDDLPMPGESLPAVAAPAADEPLPAPPGQAEASPTTAKKSFFDSDTDSSDDMPRPAPKTAAPPPKKGGLFDSDSDSD